MDKYKFAQQTDNLIIHAQLTKCFHYPGVYSIRQKIRAGILKKGTSNIHFIGKAIHGLFSMLVLSDSTTDHMFFITAILWYCLLSVLFKIKFLIKIL